MSYPEDEEGFGSQPAPVTCYEEVDAIIKSLQFGNCISNLTDTARILASEIDDLRAQLAACAAGPWRYDVENAPKDKYCTVWYKDEPDCWFKARHTAHGWEGPRPTYETMQTPDAFAVPNPPQVTT